MGEFLDLLQTNLLLKKEPALWSKYGSSTSKVVISDGNRFRLPSWKRKLSVHEEEIRLSPVRQTQSNRNEIYIKELSKFVVYIVTKTKEVGPIYCHRSNSG